MFFYAMIAGALLKTLKAISTCPSVLEVHYLQKDGGPFRRLQHNFCSPSRATEVTVTLEVKSDSIKT